MILFVLDLQNQGISRQDNTKKFSIIQDLNVQLKEIRLSVAAAASANIVLSFESLIKQPTMDH